VTGAVSALLATSSSKPASSGGSATFVIFLVLIALVGYFLLVRPQKQKQRRQREQQQQIGVGDEIVTVGGIVGKVIAVDPDRMTILSGGDTVGFPAVGNEPTRLVLVRNAIARKVDPPVSGAPDASSSEDAEGPSQSDADVSGVDGHLNGHDASLGGDSGEDATSESEGTST